MCPAHAQHEDRPRIRDLGVSPGILPTGPLNAITDVPGVRVGHTSVIKGDSVRTGVTAILPHNGNLRQRPVRAAVFTANGYGKAAGFLQVQELGELESPIVLTNTLSVATAVDAVVRWTLDQPGNERVRSVNALVAETNDGYLNDIRGLHVTTEHVLHAIQTAEPGPVAEGCVGAGVGTTALGFKSGIGTASRTLPPSLGGWTVGALVQPNYTGVCTIAGVTIAGRLAPLPFAPHLAADDQRPDGSCIVVLATDAPLDARNLRRLAARAPLGLARTGSFLSNGSGDFVIAFSTAPWFGAGDSRPADITTLPNDAMSPLFLAAVEATEEAVYNALTRATDTTGRDGHTARAIPIEPLRTLLSEPPPPTDAPPTRR